MPSKAVGTGLQDAIGRAYEIVVQRPAALVTDIDGTISRIVARPEDALVSDRARRALSKLAERLDLVAVITAREEAVARSMLRLEGIAYIGNYALDATARSGLDSTAIDALKAQARTLVAELPCVVLEEKGISFALHFRNCAEPEEVRRQLVEAMERLLEPSSARLLDGKRVIEVVPASLPDKGVAVSNLARQHDIRSIVYLGDDVSDVSVFREIAQRRELGLAGLAVAISDAETDPRVREAADLIIDGVESVEAFLEGVVEAIVKGGPL